MAVGMLMAGEGVNADVYRQLTEKMFGTYPMRSDQAPEGLICHSAGEREEGFYIYDLWESKEDFERFAEGMLMPAMQAIMGDDMPGPEERPQPQFFDVEVVVLGKS